MEIEKLKVVLMEYQKHRDEIERRSKEQFLSVAVAIGSISTIIGLASRNSDNYFLFLLIPWILSIFGIVWLDNAIGILKLNIHIKNEIENRKMKIIFGDNKEQLLNWETSLHIKGRLSLIELFIPLIFFILPSIAVIWIFIKTFYNQLSFSNLTLILLFYPTLIVLLLWKLTQIVIIIKSSSKLK